MIWESVNEFFQESFCFYFHYLDFITSKKDDEEEQRSSQRYYNLKEHLKNK